MSVYICLSSQECSTFDCKKNFKVKTRMNDQISMEPEASQTALHGVNLSVHEN